MKAAIIGPGNIGSRNAKNLIAGNQNIIISDLSKAVEFGRKLGGKAEVVPIDERNHSAQARIEP